MVINCGVAKAGKKNALAVKPARFSESMVPGNARGTPALAIRIAATCATAKIRDVRRVDARGLPSPLLPGTGRAVQAGQVMVEGQAPAEHISHQQ